METIEKEDSFDIFICILGMMCKLDIAFSKYDMKCEESGQFSEGKDIFGSSTACVGFVVASAEYILGKISVERSIEKISEKRNNYKKQMDLFLNELEENKKERPDYLSLDILNSKCAGLPKNRIGDEMRILFKDAFMSILKYEDIDEISHNRPVPPVTIADLNNAIRFDDRSYLNEEIKEMFFALDLIESYGSGIRRAKKAMEDNRSPKLIFTPDNETDDYTMVTAFINEEYAKIYAEEKGNTIKRTNFSVATVT